MDRIDLNLNDPPYFGQIQNSKIKTRAKVKQSVDVNQFEEVIDEEETRAYTNMLLQDEPTEQVHETKKTHLKINSKKD